MIELVPNVILDEVTGYGFGGYIYNLNYQRQYGSAASTVKVNFLSEDGNYSITSGDLQTANPITIRVGNFTDEFFPTSYRKNKSPAGKTLEVSYIDRSIILDKKFIGLPNLHGYSGQTGQDFIIPNAVDKRIRIIEAYQQLPSGIGNSTIINLRDRLTVTLPEYEYNLDILLSGLSANGIGINRNGIDTTEFSGYYVNSVAPARDVLGQVCGNLGLGFFWSGTGIVLEDLRSGISASRVDNFISGLDIKYIADKNESVSIEDNFSRVAHSFYSQPGGKYEDTSSYRFTVTWSGVSPDMLGITRNTAVVGVQTVGKENQYFINSAYKKKYLIRNLMGMTTQDFWVYYAALGNSDGILKVTAANVQHLLKAGRFIGQVSADFYCYTIDRSTTFDNADTSVAFMDVCGKYSYALGEAKQKDRYRNATFYSSETLVNTFIPEYTGTSTVESIFGSIPNNIVPAQGKSCTNIKIYGVWIRQHPVSGVWSYDSTGTGDGHLATRQEFKSLMKLINGVQTIREDLSGINLNTQIYGKPFSSSGNSNMSNNNQRICSILKSFKDGCPCAWLSKIWYTAKETVDFQEWVEGPQNTYSVVWNQLQNFKLNGSVTEPCMKMELFSKEITPEDILEYYRFIMPDHPPASTVAFSMTTGELLTGIEDVARLKYNDTFFCKTEPTYSVTVKAHDLDIPVTQDFYSILTSINYSLTNSGPEINYNFNTRIRKLPSQDVFEQRFYTQYLPIIITKMSSPSSTVLLGDGNSEC